MTYIAKPRSSPPVAAAERARADASATTKASMSTLCAGCGHDSVTAAIVRAFYELDIAAAHGRQAVGHRLLVEDADLLRAAARTASTPRTAACRRSPPAPTPPTATLTYIGISGDGDSLSIGLGQLCHAIRRNVEHALRDREQRRLRPDQGAVLGVGRRRLEEQAGRGQHAGAHRSGAAGAEPRRHLRRAQLLGRQGAARADPEGRPGAPGLRARRRDLAVRDLQRPRGLDQELRLHARAPASRSCTPTSCRRATRSPPSYGAGHAPRA